MNSNKSISILGCGWLGFELARYLISHGFEVKGSTTSEEKLPILKSAGIQPYSINLTEVYEDLDAEFFRSSILVLNIPPGRRNPTTLKAYPDRIQLALRLALDNGVKNCILISSTGVYEAKPVLDNTLNFPRYDKDAPNGTSDSALALIAGEDKLKTYFEDRGTLLRFGGLVGGNRKAGNFLAGKKNLKNGLAPVNMIHRKDCIQIISRIIDYNHWGYQFNAVADEHPSRASFYTAQAKKNQLPPPSFIETPEVQGKIIENTNLKSVMNYQFIFPDPMQF